MVTLLLLCHISVWRVGSLYTGIWAGHELEYRKSGMVFWVGTLHKQELLWAHNGTVHLHLGYLFALGFLLSCIQRGVLSRLYLFVFLPLVFLGGVQ